MNESLLRDSLLAVIVVSALVFGVYLALKAKHYAIACLVCLVSGMTIIMALDHLSLPMRRQQAEEQVNQRILKALASCNNPTPDENLAPLPNSTQQ